MVVKPQGSYLNWHHLSVPEDLESGTICAPEGRTRWRDKVRINVVSSSIYMHLQLFQHHLVKRQLFLR